MQNHELVTHQNCITYAEAMQAIQATDCTQEDEGMHTPEANLQHGNIKHISRLVVAEDRNKQCFPKLPCAKHWRVLTALLAGNAPAGQVRGCWLVGRTPAGCSYGCTE